MTGHTPWPDARAAAYRAADPLETVTVALDDALAATLGEPLRALVPLPPFDTAAMDGYAVAGSSPWTVVGRVLAGESRVPALRTGEALEIATGAPVPAGSEAVLPYEDGRREGSRLTGELGPRPHIRRAGEECPAGVELLPAGRVVTPAVLGLAASTGHDVLRVRRVPRVAPVVTGNELLHSGTPGRGRVRDAVGPLLPGLVRWAGGTAAQLVCLPDDPHALAGTVKGEDEADVVVVCGASSAGPADHLRGVLDTLGARTLVDGVACRPGHPQTLGRLPDGRFVVGLPGNPFAALAAALTLLVPLLAALCGRSPTPAELARLVERVSPHPRDTRLVPVSCRGGSAFPVGHDSPAVLWGAAGADALAVVPPGGWDARRGNEVEVLPLPR
ncbi:MAG: molybdopterin molybdenumtransferase MoeA [Streptosporangiales bacterium]|nr:molybdopterin molybdenumtransferase MoeA [Streptosporangiales bacterium]